MNWKYKALLQGLFTALPGGEHINHWFQRHVTRSLPISDNLFKECLRIAAGHVEAVRNYLRRDLNEALFYEFGAGWDMSTTLSLYARGVSRQILVDVRILIRPWLINETISKFLHASMDPPFSRIPGRPLPLTGMREALAALKEFYGIDYRAPCDARNTGLEAESIDCITTTNTLEHIPEQDLPAIMKECHRVLSRDGVMSFLVDYQDHYSYFDPAISAYNFLQYSDDQWAKFNPRLHYQNRLRHRDYLSRYENAGFEILSDRPNRGSDSDLQLIERLSLAPRFREYTPRELAVRWGHVVLRKRR